MLPVRRPLRPARVRPRRRPHLRFRRSPRHLVGPLVVATASAGRSLRAGGRHPRAAAVTLVALTVAATAACSAARPAGAQPAPPTGPPTYVPPVDAPVVDPFRPPAGPYGPGNRGLEYGTAPGTTVRASADGTVSFAGPVGGTLHVTITHPDGIRTSYSFLATVDVVLGQAVHQGDVVGTTGGPLHLGARRGDAYFDPATLFTGVTHVELLPLEEAPAGATEAEIEAYALAQLSSPGLGLPLPGLDETVGWLHDTAAAGIDHLARIDPAGRSLAFARDLGERLLWPGPCSEGPPPSRPAAAAERRVAITVAGLGSTGDRAAIDDLRLDELGYDADASVRFSYAGGRTPASGRAYAGTVTARDYGSGDTQGDVDVAAGRLADLVEQVLAAEPGATVDLYAHSLGGLVARLALAELARRGAALDRLGLVATLGTPHRGADLATAVAAADARLVPHAALEAAGAALGVGVDPDAVVVHQLAEGSEVVTRLAGQGVPPGVDLVSIAARGDLVAAAPATEVEGAVNVTVPVAGLGAHGDLVGSDAATAELARALAGQPPGCESWYDAAADVFVGHGIALTEDATGLAVAGAGP
jgi:alpha-beta hydrolase superfamily lysophospholipase